VATAKQILDSLIARLPDELRLEACRIGYEFHRRCKDNTDRMGGYARSAHVIRLYLETIRNKHQIQMTNSQNSTNQPARGGLVLRTCSFVHWNLFRISDFGFRVLPPFVLNRGVQQRKMRVKTRMRGEGDRRVWPTLLCFECICLCVFASLLFTLWLEIEFTKL